MEALNLRLVEEMSSLTKAIQELTKTVESLEEIKQPLDCEELPAHLKHQAM